MRGELDENKDIEQRSIKERAGSGVTRWVTNPNRQRTKEQELTPQRPDNLQVLIQRQLIQQDNVSKSTLSQNGEIGRPEKGSLEGLNSEDTNIIDPVPHPSPIQIKIYLVFGFEVYLIGFASLDQILDRVNNVFVNDLLKMHPLLVSETTQMNNTNLFGESALS
jgi:hypothetical protein